MDEITKRHNIIPADPDPIIRFALADVAETTRLNYRGRLEDFLEWLSGRTFSYQAVIAYKAHLLEEGAGGSVVNQALSAIKRLARELHHAGHLEHSTYQGIDSIRGIPRKGQKVHTWLSREESRRLLDAPDPQTTKGLRDLVALHLCLSCALRRSEAAAVRWSHIQRHGATVAITNLEGKGGKIRSVPIPPPALRALQQWGEKAGREGYVLRRVDRWGNVYEEGVTDKTVYNIVVEYGEAAGISPHDLRRTWARLVYESAPERLSQVSLILGHESMKTTEVYMGLKNVDLDDPLLLEV